ncbi:WbqC family protein [Chloroflexota bacterium]
MPVQGKSDLILIKDALLVQPGKWQKNHWKTIQLSYKKAPYFNLYEGKFSQIYDASWESLNELNITIIKLIKDLLGINAKLVLSSEMNIEARGTEKIISILRKLKADRYITGEGEGSKRYMDEEQFQENDIELIYQRFEHPSYNQLWGAFESNLSIVDLLFNEGERSLPILLGASS